MTARKSMPAISRDPSGKTGACVIEISRGRFRVFCRGWVGPIRYSRRAAILAWNRRYRDADVDADAVRRWAMAAAQWIWDSWENYSMGLMSGEEIVNQLRDAIERGEVLPAKGKKGARKR